MTSANYTAPKGASPLIEPKLYTHPSRKLVQGVGTNDYPTPVVVDGKIITSYNVWSTMLSRCHSAGYHKKQPTYVGCSVVPEWHSFSTFEKWFSENYTEGYALDKDLLIPGNKVYGPDTCVFVPRALNNLLLDKRISRGACPLGVSFCKGKQKYQATVSIDAGNRHLGFFTAPLKAHQAWQLAKADIIANFPTTDPRIRAALDKRAAQLRDDHTNNRITTKL